VWFSSPVGKCNILSFADRINCARLEVLVADGNASLEPDDVGSVALGHLVMFFFSAGLHNARAKENADYKK